MLGRDKEDQSLSKPNPDPTVYTNEAIERAKVSNRDYTNGEIKVLVQRMDDFEHLTTMEFNNLKELFDKTEKVRVEQKNDSNIVLSAALASQKELSAAENASNKLAISKSEQATTETIKTNQEANNERFSQVIKSLDEVKLAVSRLETAKVAISEDRTEHRAQGNYTMAIISSMIGIVIFITGLLGAYALAKDRGPEVSTPIIVTVTTP